MKEKIEIRKKTSLKNSITYHGKTPAMARGGNEIERSSTESCGGQKKKQSIKKIQSTAGQTPTVKGRLG